MGGLNGTQHINELNLVATLEAQLKQAALPPGMVEFLKRKARQAKRYANRDNRHRSWPYCGKRHQARIARQVAAGSLREQNGFVLNPGDKCISVDCTNRIGEGGFIGAMCVLCGLGAGRLDLVP